MPDPALPDNPTRRDMRPNRLLMLIAAVHLAAVCYFARGLLIPIVLALLFWLTFNPVVRWLGKRGIHEVISAAVITLLIALAGLATAYLASGPMTRYLQDLPGMTTELQFKMRSMADSVEGVFKAGKALDEAGEKITGDEHVQKVVLQGPGLVFTVAQNVQYVLTTVAATLVLLFFLLASGSFFHIRLVEVFDRMGDKKRALSLLLAAESDVSRYILSVGLINLGLGLAVGGLLALVGMPDPLSWGLMATLLNFVPYVGALIGIVTVAAASILEFDSLQPMLAGPAAYLVLTLLEGQFVTPMVLGRRFDVNPVVILLAVALWGWLWGIVGAIVAVPLLVAAKVICAQSGVAPLFVHFISTHGTVEAATLQEPA